MLATFVKPMVIAALSGAMMSLATPAAAQDAPAEPQEAEAAAPEEAEAEAPAEQVCRTVRRTGTRFRTRVCRDADEWKEDEEITRENTTDYRRRNNDPASLFEDQYGPRGNSQPGTP